MDFEEMQNKIRELESMVREMRENPDLELRTAAQNSLVIRTEKAAPYVETTNISHTAESAINVDVNHNKQADVMLQVEYNGKFYLIPAYRADV